jgi:hypothetical protein
MHPSRRQESTTESLAKLGIDLGHGDRLEYAKVGNRERRTDNFGPRSCVRSRIAPGRHRGCRAGIRPECTLAFHWSQTTMLTNRARGAAALVAAVVLASCFALTWGQEPQAPPKEGVADKVKDTLPRIGPQSGRARPGLLPAALGQAPAGCQDRDHRQGIGRDPGRDRSRCQGQGQGAGTHPGHRRHHRGRRSLDGLGGQVRSGQALTPPRRPSSSASGRPSRDPAWPLP